MVDLLVFIRIWLLFLFNVTAFFFPEDQGLNIDSVSAVKVLDDVNGKQYILSAEQRPYINCPAGCAAINASPAFFDTNADFMAMRSRLRDPEFLLYTSIWVNITIAGTGAGTQYFWEKEEVSGSLWWSREPNRQGAWANMAECKGVSDTCRPVHMTRVRDLEISDTHYLMDTCCLYEKYFICEDIDECHQPDRCPALSQCVNTPGSYRCQCNPGYQLNASGLCEDMDECHQPARCPVLNHCLNTPGSYHCQCNPGYQLNASGLCEDIDECTGTGTFTCPTYSNCSNTPGGYICSCSVGYEMNDTACEDIDECNSTGTFTCPTNCKCSNTPGSYICLCNEGYEINNTVCADIDECNSTGTFTCPTNSTCSNTPGSVICLCNEGYEMNNTVCEDIDECKSTGTFTCPTNSKCSKTPGSYTCLCNERYEMNNNACADIDECNRTGTFTCTTNSKCSNTPGSYSCLCNEGYEMNDTVCADIEECNSTGTFTCPTNSTCSNTPGGYICLCNEGYEMNGTVCAEVPGPFVIMASPVTPVRLGSRVVLFCQTFNANLAHASTTLYRWLKDGVDLQNPRASLRLDNVTRQDAGGFQCYVTNGVSLEPSRSTPFLLSLIGDNEPVSDQTTIKCPCRCHRYPVYDHTEGPPVGISGLYIQMDKLSSRIRARTSANDWRAVTVITGSSAVAFLVGLLFITTAVDVLTILFK